MPSSNNTRRPKGIQASHLPQLMYDFWMHQVLQQPQQKDDSLSFFSCGTVDDNPKETSVTCGSTHAVEEFVFGQDLESVVQEADEEEKKDDDESVVVVVEEEDDQKQDVNVVVVVDKEIKQQPPPQDVNPEVIPVQKEERSAWQSPLPPEPTDERVAPADDKEATRQQEQKDDLLLPTLRQEVVEDKQADIGNSSPAKVEELEHKETVVPPKDQEIMESRTSPPPPDQQQPPKVTPSVYGGRRVGITSSSSSSLSSASSSNRRRKKADWKKAQARRRSRRVTTTLQHPEDEASGQPADELDKRLVLSPPR